MKNTTSFQAGIAAANLGHNINNSYPFDHDEFVAGYKSVKSDCKTMLDECRSDQEVLDMLAIIKLCK